MDDGSSIDSDASRASESPKKSQNDIDCKPTITPTRSPLNIIKNEGTSKRFRKKYTWERVIVNREKLQGSSNNESIKNKFYLKVVNFPTDWSVSKVKEFILEEYGPIDEFYMGCNDDLCFEGTIKLEFEHFHECRKAWHKLNEKIVDDVQLFADTIESDEEVSDDDSSPKKKRKTQELWRPNIDVWETDPQGLYGLKPEFLSSLGIEPPIGRWVQVTNFRCDKSELKDVLELAGQVLICNLDVRLQKIAKVMYSHPLEAVQAVSMLNNQQFYGQALKVSIERCTGDQLVLPKGLQAVGSGLGVAGKPLRDIVKQYERFVNYKSSSVNLSVFRNPDLLFSPNKIDITPPDEIDNHQTPNLQSNTWNSWNTNQSLGANQSVNVTRSIPVTSFGPVTNFVQSGPALGYSGQNFSAPTTAGLGFRSIGHLPVPGPSGPNIGIMSRPHNAMPGPMHNPSSLMSRLSGPIHGPTGPMFRSSGSMAGPMHGLSGPMPGSFGSMQSRSVPMHGPSGPMPGPPGPMPGSSGPMSGLSGPMHGPTGLTLGPTGPMHGPTGPMPGSSGPLPPAAHNRSMYGAAGSLSGFNGPHNANMSNPMSGNGIRPVNGSPAANQSRPNEYIAIELSNLPLSTTFALLTEKMAQCGQVMSLQLTSPGCAIVQFAQRVHADKCYPEEQYNNLRVMGNVIEAKFV